MCQSLTLQRDRFRCGAQKTSEQDEVASDMIRMIWVTRTSRFTKQLQTHHVIWSMNYLQEAFLALHQRIGPAMVACILAGMMSPPKSVRIRATATVCSTPWTTNAVPVQWRISGTVSQWFKYTPVLFHINTVQMSLGGCRHSGRDPKFRVV